MRVPLSWMREYVEVNESVEEVDRILTNAGLEVKTIERIGIEGADLVWDREKIVLSHILKVERHPNADKLVLATVDYGAEEPEVCVTGAPNLFEFVGQGDIAPLKLYAPLALEGAELYDGHKDGKKKTKLKGRPLRGIFNRSMVCSEKELGISDDHEGIILMQDDEWSPDYAAGTPMQDVLGDAIYDIDIIPSIARCASIVGTAREYAALVNRPIVYPNYEITAEGAAMDGRVSITIEEPELNPRFVALLIEGVEQKPSPYWMQNRLRMVGMRPINVVVDISNYVMMEMGQPNHTFDYDFLRARADEYAPDGAVQLITRLPHEGETITTLDGAVHELEPYSILVTDPAGNLSVGGVMGGANSEIKPSTTNVLLEAAAWNFINIRRTGVALDIHTDAGFRFSRGVHPSQAMLGAKRAAGLLHHLAGGTIAQGMVDNYPMPPETLQIRLDLTYARRLSGLDLSGAEMGELLERLEFGVSIHPPTSILPQRGRKPAPSPSGRGLGRGQDVDHLMVTVPDYRMDIEGGHDLVEEICRLYGYGRIPSTVLADVLPPQRGNWQLEQEERVKDLLARSGMQEIITFRLTSADDEAKLLGGVDERPFVTLTNPLSGSYAVMRHSLLASVMEIVATNSRHQERIALFEIGPIFLDEGAQLPTEATRLALAMTGKRDSSNWQHTAVEMMDFYDMKGVLEQLFAALHVDVTYAAGDDERYRPGRAAKMMVGEQQIGMMGELHPLRVEAYGMRLERGQAVLAADVDLTAVIAHIPSHYPFEAVSSYPAVHEDVALIVDAAIPAAEVEAAIRQAGGFLLKEAALFDVYEGDQIGAGKRSLAYHLTFLAPNKTLTDKAVRKQRTRIVKMVERKLGARLRD